MPNLFDPITLGNVTFANRLWISPMCQYQAVDGVVGEWHHAHIGALATGGAGAIVMEATGVVPEGRISIACPGLWNQEQVEALKPIVAFAHSQGVKMGIQLAHAGRKASTMQPWADHKIATEEEGGWEPVSASPLTFHGLSQPRELTIDEIGKLVIAFGQAAARAVSAGFDFVELHAAHGYLMHQFLSPLSNLRTDSYGGDFAGRTRLIKEVVSSIRANLPVGFPLTVRISATDWADNGWDIEQSVELAKELKALGVDLIDVSSGGTVHDAKIPIGPAYQTPFAERIKNEVGIAVSTVGYIETPQLAQSIVAEGKADVVMIARAALRNPRFPLLAATELEANVTWPKSLALGKPRPTK
jgi:2,4-dienoyl-CoA reductase-like NADH-dependent reductase (Old Yellow Enzyme family)